MTLKVEKSQKWKSPKSPKTDFMIFPKMTRIRQKEMAATPVWQGFGSIRSIYSIYTFLLLGLYYTAPKTPKT